jgi:CO/xanthine dehydrogenase Mo-binding subunit
LAHRLRGDAADASRPWDVDLRLDVPPAAHAPIEPRACVAEWTADDELHAWVGSQDVFYVRDLFGLKVTHKGQLARIRERLLEALTDPEEIATPSTPRPGGVARSGEGPNG